MEAELSQPLEQRNDSGTGGRDALGRFAPGNGYSFRPGESGNSRGRRDSLMDHLTRFGAEDVGDGRTRNELLAWRAWSVVLDPKTPLSVFVQVLVFITERVHGKPKQSVDLGLLPNEPGSDELEALLAESGLRLVQVEAETTSLLNAGT